MVEIQNAQTQLKATRSSAAKSSGIPSILRASFGGGQLIKSNGYLLLIQIQTFIAMFHVTLHFIKKSKI